MITTVTLNAAIDKAYSVDKMQPSNVMRVNQCTNTAGGKGLNVARIIAATGNTVSATGFIGGYNGEYLRALLAETGVKDTFLSVAGETRCCINVIDESGTSTEFLEPGFTVTPQELEQFSTHFEQCIQNSSVVTLSGSMPKGCPDTFYQTLITIAKNAGKKVILDTSGNFLRFGIEALPTIIKPNSDEIITLMAAHKTAADTVTIAKELVAKGIEYVVLSQGKDGAVMVCNEGVFKAKAPSVAAKNPVGCGDSMVGALAIALEQQMPAEKMLQYAVEISAASAMHEKTGGFSFEDYQTIKNSVIVQRLEE